eukprot:s55_g30.t1
MWRLPSRARAPPARVLRAILPGLAPLRGGCGTRAIASQVEASCHTPAALAAVLLLPIGFWYWRQQPTELPMPKALQASGASIHPSVRKSFTTAGAGLVLRCAVPQGQCLLRVPRSAVLSGHLAQNLLQAPSLEPDVALCTLLAEARRCAEQGNDLIGMRDYLLALPRAFPSLPWFLHKEDAAAELRGTALQPCLRVLIDKEDENRQAVLSLLGDRLQAPWSLERWRWARATFMTRAGVYGLEEDGNVGIVPLVDFANCSADPTAACCINGEFIELVTVRPLEAGEEVTISYGQQSQEQQLFTFGFFLDNSPQEIMTPLAMMAEGDGQENRLRQALLRLLFLERSEGDAAVQEMPPFAMLRKKGQVLDLAELYATAQLLEMSQTELGEVAKQVEATARRRERPTIAETLVALIVILTTLQFAALRAERSQTTAPKHGARSIQKCGRNAVSCWGSHRFHIMGLAKGPFENPLQLSGGNCSEIHVKGLNATDLTSTQLSPAFALHLRASLRCTVLVSNGAVRIGFAVDNATADLGFAVQPVVEPTSKVVVPLGKVEVTRCYISFVMSMLQLHGTDSVELPEVACSQLEPLMEKQASAALSSVLVQLAPFLTSNPPLPPEPAARPGVTLVNWGSYPPAQLLRALVQRRPERVAGIIQRIRPQKIPLDMLGINRSVSIDSLGTTLRSYTEELTVEGFNSFVPGSLAIQGSGSHVWSTASFGELRFGAKLQAQVRSVDPKKLTQEIPLLEEFQVQLQLGVLAEKLGGPSE